jgi:hypothetical protein
MVKSTDYLSHNYWIISSLLSLPPKHIINIPNICHSLTVGDQISQTPSSRVLLEKLKVPHLVTIFLEFYVTRRFITVFTTAFHLFLCSAWQKLTVANPASAHFLQRYALPPINEHISVDQKLIRLIQFQSLVFYLDLPNGTFHSRVQRQWQ